jgi:hypothetical protein
MLQTFYKKRPCFWASLNLACISFSCLNSARLSLLNILDLIKVLKAVSQDCTQLIIGTQIISVAYLLQGLCWHISPDFRYHIRTKRLNFRGSGF